MSLGHLLAGNETESLKGAKKAVQLFPGVTENWAVLLAAVYGKVSQSSSAKDVLWLKKTISHVDKVMNPSKGLTQWVRLCEESVNVLVTKVLY